MRTGGNRSAGFTIVETLIVLTISSIMATSAMILVGGRQNSTQFQVASNNLKQQLEQVINETANGYYQQRKDFKCTASSGTVLIQSASNVPQGTNSDCIFLGKAVSFGVAFDAASAPAAESFTTYPLIGNRYVPGINGQKNEVSSFSEAKPIALADGTAPWTSVVDYSDKRQTQNGLSLYGVRYRIRDPATGTVGAPTNRKAYGVIALADSLSQYAVRGDGLVDSGAQDLQLYDYDLSSDPAWATMPTTSKQTVASMDKSNIDAQTVSEVQLCYGSGGTNKSVLITIGGLGQLSVSSKIYDGQKCGWS